MWTSRRVRKSQGYGFMWVSQLSKFYLQDHHNVFMINNQEPFMKQWGKHNPYEIFPCVFHRKDLLW